MVQSSSIAAALQATFGWDRLAVGAAVAVLTGLVMVGGIGRIARVSSGLVPAMALLYLGAGRRCWLPGPTRSRRRWH